MPKIKLDKYEYNRIIYLIDKYLSDIFVDDNGEIQLLNAEDLLSDILTELGIEKE